MQELVDGDRRKDHGPEIDHLVAHAVGIELHARRVLHPGIGHQNPQRRQRRANGREPSGGQVHAGAHLVPAKEHDGHEGRLHKEGHDAFDGQRGAENVAHEPTVIGPVGAELKFENNAGGNAQGKIHAKKVHPVLGNLFPTLVPGTIIDGLHAGDNEPEAQRQRDKQPMIQGRERKLRPRPVDK